VKVTPYVFTTSWHTIWLASRFGGLTVTPTRISRGLPKMIAGADRFPVCEQLFVPGWTLNESVDDARAEKAYRHRLYRITADRIKARLDEIAEAYGQAVVLACFEQLGAGKPCHRWWFARWAGEHLGITVPELSLMQGFEGGAVLCWECPAGTTGQNSGRARTKAPANRATGQNDNRDKRQEGARP
jgi:hypothetical protein